MPPDPNVAALLAWAVDRGIAVHRSLGFEGRTITAREDVAPDTTCFTVPAACLLTAAHASPGHPHYGPAFTSAALPDRDALCLALLAERCAGDASAWAPYIAALPRSYDDPTWWSAEDAALLAGSRAGASADTAWAHVLRLTAAAVRLEEGRRAAGLGPGPLADAAVPSNLDIATLSRLETVAANHGWTAPQEPSTTPTTPFGLSAAGAAWARSTVWSRAFNLPPVGSGKAALVPVVDLLDHDPGVGVAWWMDERPGGEAAAAGDAGPGPQPLQPSSFQWAAASPVPAGTPLQMNYSPHKSSEELMCGYGFTLPANPADFFHAALGVGGDEAAAVAALLRAAWLPRDLYVRAGDPLPPSALTAAVVALSPAPERARLEAALVWRSGGGEEEREEETGKVAAPPAPPPSLHPIISVGPAPPRPSRPPALTTRRPASSDVGVPACLATQCAALKALRSDLRARAAKLGGGGQVGCALPTPASLAAAAAEDKAAAAAAAAAGSHHAAMAHAYVAGQRRLAGAALAALEARAAGVVAAGVEAASAAGLLQLPPAGGADSTPAWGVHPAPGVREVGVAPPAPRWGWGLALPAEGVTAKGSTLLEVPAGAVLLFPRGASECAASAVRAAAADPPASPTDLAARAWAHLMSAWGIGGADNAWRRPSDATAALASAAAAAAWPVDGSTAVALIPLAWAVPSHLRDLAVDLEWAGTPGSSGARLVAACDLPPGCVLCPALTLPGALADEAVGEFGPALMDALAAAPPLDVTLGGPSPLLHAVPLWLAPDGEGEEEEGEGAATGPVSTALAAAGLAGPHWLGADEPAGRVARLTAALVVMGASQEAREAAGVGGLVAARTVAAAAWAAAKDAAGAGRDDAADADKRADAAAKSFITAMLTSSRSVRAAAAESAVGLIQGEMEAVADGGEDEDEEEAPAVAAALRPGRLAALQACYTAAVEALEREEEAAAKQKQKKKKKQRRVVE